MILTHQQIVEKNLISKGTRDHFLIMDLSNFQKNDEDEQNLKLALELIAKMKMYEKVNIFYQNVCSDFEIEIEKLYPVLDHLLKGETLTAEQLRDFFEVEKSVCEFEEYLYALGNEPEWGFSYRIHAHILGVPLSYLSNLEYCDDRDQVLAFEEFQDIIDKYLMNRITYEDLHGRLKGWYINVNRAA